MPMPPLQTSNSRVRHVDDGGMVTWIGGGEGCRGRWRDVKGVGGDWRGGRVGGWGSGVRLLVVHGGDDGHVLYGRTRSMRWGWQDGGGR